MNEGGVERELRRRWEPEGRRRREKEGRGSGGGASGETRGERGGEGEKGGEGGEGRRPCEAEVSLEDMAEKRAGWAGVAGLVVGWWEVFLYV